MAPTAIPTTAPVDSFADEEYVFGGSPGASPAVPVPVDELLDAVPVVFAVVLPPPLAVAVAPLSWDICHTKFFRTSSARWPIVRGRPLTELAILLAGTSTSELTQIPPLGPLTPVC